MKRLTLSVLTPNYNDAPLIGGCIECVAAQTRLPDEMIIVDDGSTDDSVAVIERYRAKHSWIRFVRGGENRGTVVRSDQLVSMAQGEFLFGLAADDRIMPDFIQHSMATLERHPGAGLCCCDAYYVYESPPRFQEHRLRWSPVPAFLLPSRLAAMRPYPEPSCFPAILRRSALLATGGYPAALHWYTDLLINWVVAARHGICYVPEPLFVFLRREAAYSSPRRKPPRVALAAIRELLRRLKSPEYRDVLPYFQRGGFLSCLKGLIPVALISPEHWDTDTLALLHQVAWTQARNLLHGSAYRRLPLADLPPAIVAVLR